MAKSNKKNNNAGYGQVAIAGLGGMAARVVTNHIDQMRNVKSETASLIVMGAGAAWLLSTKDENQQSAASAVIAVGASDFVNRFSTRPGCGGLRRVLGTTLHDQVHVVEEDQELQGDRLNDA